MTSWFGHTQTLTSISKSVTTAAGGIMHLEANVTTFMRKVIYYKKFFHRVSAKLPSEVVMAAELLFEKCYEYRNEIREELESKVAYVADAGRWMIGMDDWNSKMEKRLLQVNELVLLANSLLAEYALNGSIGASDSKEELVAYLQQFTSSIVLKHSVRYSRVEHPGRGDVEQKNSGAAVERSGEIDSQRCCGEAEEKDDDQLNPFSQAYSRSKVRTADIHAEDSDATEDSIARRHESRLSFEIFENYECLQKESIPSYSAFKRTTKRISNHIKRKNTNESAQSQAEDTRSEAPKYVMKSNDHLTGEEAKPFITKRKVNAVEKVDLNVSRSAEHAHELNDLHMDRPLHSAQAFQDKLHTRNSPAKDNDSH